MNDREHEALRIDLGAHALGALRPEEAAALEGHLAGCAACRAELAELRPAATVLDELRSLTGPTGLPADQPTAPPGLAARIEADLAGHRRRAWLRRGAVAVLAGAAAAVVLVVGLAVVGDDQEPAPTVPMEAVDVEVSAPGVEADAALVNHTWGVEVKLQGSGFRDGGRYVVNVLGTGGRTFPAGEFVGTGDAEMLCNLNSSVLRDRATGFEVRDPRGRVVVSSRFQEA